MISDLKERTDDKKFWKWLKPKARIALGIPKEGRKMRPLSRKQIEDLKRLYRGDDASFLIIRVHFEALIEIAEVAHEVSKYNTCVQRSEDDSHDFSCTKIGDDPCCFCRLGSLFDLESEAK